MIAYRQYIKYESRLWEQYLVRYSTMTKTTYQPYEAPIFDIKPVIKRSQSEILAEVNNIRSAFNKEDG